MRTVGGAFGAAVATAILTAETIGNTTTPTEGAYTTAFVLSAGGGLLAICAALMVPSLRAERAAAAAAEPAPAAAVAK
jgi:cyanate permease